MCVRKEGEVCVCEGGERCVCEGGGRGVCEGGRGVLVRKWERMVSDGRWVGLAISK